MDRLMDRYGYIHNLFSIFMDNSIRFGVCADLCVCFLPPVYTRLYGLSSSTLLFKCDWLSLSGFLCSFLQRHGGDVWHWRWIPLCFVCVCVLHWMPSSPQKTSTLMWLMLCWTFHYATKSLLEREPQVGVGICAWVYGAVGFTLSVWIVDWCWV